MQLIQTLFSLFFLACPHLTNFEPTIGETELSELLSSDKLLFREPVFITPMAEVSSVYARYLGMYRNAYLQNTAS